MAEYLDDIIIAGKDEEINDITNNLKSKDALEDLGQIFNYLRVKIHKTDNGFKLNQTAKITEFAKKKINLEYSKPYSTPMETGFQRLDNEEAQMPNNTKYRQAIGALLYVATISRPNLLVGINILSRKNETPSERDWGGVKRLIRYLYSAKELKLVIRIEEPPILEVYTDADWGGDLKTRR